MMSQRTNIRLVAMIALASLAGMACAVAQTDWTLRASGSPNVLSGVAYGGGCWVVVGDGGEIRISDDSLTWVAATSGTTMALRSVVWSGQQFVAVGQVGTILTSPDGSTWTPRASGVSVFLSGIAYANGRFVAVGGSGTVLTSTNGRDWFPAVSNTFRFLQSVAEGGGKFVAVGASGAIIESTDGLAWSFRNSGVTSALSGGGWFKGTFIAAGQDGKIRSSANGQAWTAVGSGTLKFLRAVASDGLSMVVVGEDGTILVSTDGVTWTPKTSGVTDYLNGVVFANGLYCAVGDLRSVAPGKGIILTSPAPVRLEAALDGDCLAWTNDRTMPWGTQGAVTRDGVDAAVSAPGLSAGQASSLETVIEGPASVSFSWKVSAGAGDMLELMIDGANGMLIRGEQDWVRANVPIGIGSHVLRWSYVRGPGPATGQNLAWLDEVAGSYIYNDWAIAYFDSGELADPTMSGPSADKDGDGLANFFEYYADTNPKNSSDPSDGLPLFQLTVDSHVSFLYRRHVKRSGGSTARIEAASDLVDWQPQSATEEVLSTAGMIETVRLTATETFGLSGRKFYRLSLQTQP